MSEFVHNVSSAWQDNTVRVVYVETNKYQIKWDLDLKLDKKKNKFSFGWTLEWMVEWNRWFGDKLNYNPKSNPVVVVVVVFVLLSIC